MLSFEQYVKLRLLLSLEGIGPGKLKNLLLSLKSLDNILAADLDTLMRAEGISLILAQRIRNSHNKTDSIKKIIESETRVLDSIKASVITIWDPEYPELLKKIYDPPFILYIVGEISEADANSVAIVGTRKPTVYGKLQAEAFASALALQNITIVSGMARGIDSIAHRFAIESSGRTIAVTGSGLDYIYPPENRELFHRIAENGAVISEYEPGTKPDAVNFPRRNRIIAGLSLGTVVIETKETGGAMQTAAFALEQGREVFSVPGNLNSPQSSGTNLLIQKGEAKLVRSAEDIMVELRLIYKPEKQYSATSENRDLNMFEEKLLMAIDETPRQIDVISEITKMDIPECLTYLLSLEIKGLIRQFPGKMFARVQSGS